MDVATLIPVMRNFASACGILAIYLAMAMVPGTVSAQSPAEIEPVSGYIPTDPARPAVPDLSVAEFDTSASADELLESAREMFLADNYPLAEMLYKAVLIREPNHLSAMLELAIIYEETNKLQYARGLLTRALILKPYDEEIISRNNEVAQTLSKTLKADIDSLLARQAYAKALPKLSVLLTTQPENAELHFHKAQCHLALHDVDGAFSEIEKAISLRKDDRYFAFRTQTLTIKKNREIGELTREARVLMISGTPDDRNQVLALLSRILAHDPDHVWARRQFLMLTEGGGQPGAPVTDEDEPGRFAGFVGAASERAIARVSGLAMGILDTLNRHLNVLLLALAVLIIFGSPLTYMIVRGFEPHQSLSGRLNQFSISDVLSMVNSQGRTGVLRVYADSAKGRVFFKSGEIQHCTCENLKGMDALKKILDTAADGHFVFTKPPRSVPTTIDTPLSLVLLDLAEREKKTGTKLPQPSSAAKPKKKSKMKALLESKV
jgi:tetratricopeptide (TPR) repeat protein